MMKFVSGDRVKFLNDVGGGIIQSVDKKIAYVLMDDGFEVPVLLTQLILDEKISSGNLKQQFSEKQNFDETESLHKLAITEVFPIDNSDEPEPVETGENPAFSIYYAIVPRKSNIQISEQFELYLINDSEFMLLFNVLEKVDDFFRSLKSGKLEAATKIFIRTFTREELNEFPKLKFQALFLRKGLHNVYSPVHKDFHPEPSSLFFFQGFAENDFFDAPAFVRKIVEDTKPEDYSINPISLKKLINEKDASQPLKVIKSATPPDIEEVDLHIHELIDNYANLSNSEILEIQMARFTTTLEGALRSETKRIVFIHGVGNGKLKFEIRKELDKKYPRLKYQDASFKEYGFGATMVILKK